MKMGKSFMNKIMVVLILLTSSVLNFAQTAEKEEEWKGTAEQKIWGLMTVWYEAKTNFPFF